MLVLSLRGSLYSQIEDASIDGPMKVSHVRQETKITTEEIQAFVPRRHSADVNTVPGK